MLKNHHRLGERTFQICNNTLMLLLSLIFILPFWNVLVTSFVSEAEAAQRGSFILWPEHFDFGSYKALLNNSLIYSGYKNTLLVVVVGTLFNLLVTTMMAYGLSKKFVPGRGTITMMVFITMLFSGGLIPTFLVNQALGMVNNRWVLILMGLVSPWNMFIMRNFFMQLPASLEEAAAIDGSGPARTLLTIVLPISLPVMMTIGLFYAVGHWNAWFSAMIYINDTNKLPVQNVLRQMMDVTYSAEISNEMASSSEAKPLAEAVRSAAIMVCTLPIMCVYPFIQKYFVKGVMVGSVKG